MYRSVQELAQTSISQATLGFPKASNLLSKATSQTADGNGSSISPSIRNTLEGHEVATVGILDLTYKPIGY